MRQQDTGKAASIGRTTAMTTAATAKVPAGKPPTIREVAVASGVSVQTVSAILNDKPGQASVETRERVLRAVRDLGYRPASRWRGVSSTQTDTIGVYSGMHPSYVYFEYVSHGIQTAAADARKHLTLFSNAAWFHNVGSNIRRFCDGRCDGLLVVAPELDDPHLIAMRERGIPFVVIGSNGSVGGMGEVDSADVDNVGGSRVLTEHLLSLGHRRIALLAGPIPRASTEQRRRGYQEALHAAGITPDPALDIPGDYGIASGRERAYALFTVLAPDARPTALVCSNDGVARGAILGVQDAGLSVPGDVSVVGFDDGPEATTEEPHLTTICQPFRNIGKTAVELLLRRIADPNAPVEAAGLPGELIVRASTGPVVEL